MKPWRSRKLLNAARDMPCIRCGREGETRACHYNGIRQHAYGKGRGQKACDLCVSFFCHDCDQLFSEGRLDMWENKMEKSEEFQHYILLSLIMAVEMGIIEVPVKPRPSGKG